MKNIRLLIGLAFLLFVSSCCQNETVTCNNGLLQVHLVGNFLTSAPVTVRYKQDNAFDVAIDTLATDCYFFDGDTLTVEFKPYDSSQTAGFALDDSMAGGFLLLGYDYKIFFPLDTLTYSITNLNATGISQMQVKKCDGSGFCYRNAASCDINGASTPTILYEPGVQEYGERYTYINIVK